MLSSTDAQKWQVHAGPEQATTRLSTTGFNDQGKYLISKPIPSSGSCRQAWDQWLQPMKQTTFAGLAYSQKKKQTRRENFLTEMDQVIP